MSLRQMLFDQDLLYFSSALYFVFVQTAIDHQVVTANQPLPDISPDLLGNSLRSQRLTKQELTHILHPQLELLYHLSLSECTHYKHIFLYQNRSLFLEVAVRAAMDHQAVVTKLALVEISLDPLWNSLRYQRLTKQELKHIFHPELELLYHLPLFEGTHYKHTFLCQNMSHFLEVDIPYFAIVLKVLD
jgi:hypothetical protein